MSEKIKLLTDLLQYTWEWGGGREPLILLIHNEQREASQNPALSAPSPTPELVFLVKL